MLWCQGAQNMLTNTSRANNNNNNHNNNNNKKSAQSNLGRGPRRGTVAHVRRKVPIGYNGTPLIRPKGTPSRRPIPRTHYLPHPRSCPT